MAVVNDPGYRVVEVDEVVSRVHYTQEDHEQIMAAVEKLRAKFQAVGESLDVLVYPNKDFPVAGPTEGWTELLRRLCHKRMEWTIPIYLTREVSSPDQPLWNAWMLARFGKPSLHSKTANWEVGVGYIGTMLAGVSIFPRQSAWKTETIKVLKKAPK